MLVVVVDFISVSPADETNDVASRVCDSLARGNFVRLYGADAYSRRGEIFERVAVLRTAQETVPHEP